jgi:hypothetical protein
MAVSSGVVGALYKQSATTHAFTTQAATLQADNRTVVINSSTYAGFVRDSALFTVYRNASPVTARCAIHYDRIIFEEDQSAGTWTISGTYAELTQYAACYEWSVDIKEKLNSYVAFGGGGWESKVKGVKGWTASAKHYEILDEITAAQDSDTIVRLYTDIDTHASLVGYVKRSGLKVTDKAEGLAEQEVNFEGSLGLIYCSYA